MAVELRCNWSALTPNVASSPEVTVAWVDGLALMCFAHGGDYSVQTGSLIEALVIAERMLLKWD